MDRVLVALETGVAQGAMIALVAIGYTLVYGVLRLINFAHGEVFMMGAYAGLFALVAVDGRVAGRRIRGGTAFAVLAASALGVAIERVAYRPLRMAIAPPVGRIGGSRASGRWSRPSARRCSCRTSRSSSSARASARTRASSSARGPS